MKSYVKRSLFEIPDEAGLIALPVRLVIGWTYFSAFWRRVALENKLDPDVAGYIGEKFNHFLPNALGIKPIIGYLLTHPDLLKWAMITFTVVEAVVGLCVMLGLCTRLMSIGVLALASGILLGSGWLGTTCLDEWQIGILGVASGFMLFLTGGGRYSLDRLLAARGFSFARSRWFARLASGSVRIGTPFVLVGSAAAMALTLFTNQYFHGGVYGPLHNKSIAPRIEVSDASLTSGALQFTVYRTEGVDVYGSFLIGVDIVDTDTQKPVLRVNGEELSSLPAQNITNHYVAKVKPGEHSLVVPLGAKAQVVMDTKRVHIAPGRMYTVVLTDISGATWSSPIT
ncbi:DoxX family membrane protein [Mycobacterium sp. CBMA271]|uniref:TQO small subunit DoxD n=1 Tax=unclassified Mycobacteroides TaxID=2618759 RepID=UPI0012DF1A61|nr:MULTISPECIES: TQO small subunit DoxD [unclassified Mycobacteroides]MUM19318.1 quinol oxidase [Mycobacteroides sp. CBMA 326]MUM21731.1 DoxX family membrane protein [Mycobacteroides sp. CBMA 271]